MGLLDAPSVGLDDHRALSARVRDSRVVLVTLKPREVLCVPRIALGSCGARLVVEASRFAVFKD
jgi:hypothetical protein